MCGICGVIGFNDLRLVKKMSKALKHRGPNAEGFFSAKNVDLGHRRLSIIDIKSGKQPMTNEDNKVWIIYNGEIYNYKSLREELTNHSFKTNSDTEVIIHLYEEYGLDFIKKLNGIFAFALYDDNKKQVIIARDRIGTKPIYYYQDKKGFCFSSEIKSLLEDKRIKKEINFDVLKEYIQFGFTTGPETIIGEISKVLPGEMLIYDIKSKSLSKKIFFDFNFEEKQESESYYKNKLFKELKSSVNDQLMSEVPLGVYLSGGLDSSTIVALMRINNPKSRIRTFSVGFQSKEVKDELEFAKLVAKMYKTDHKEIIVKSESIKQLPKIVYALDEPITNLASIPLYFMAKEASKEVKVVLSGNGADELFAGYMQHRTLNFILSHKYLLKIGKPFIFLLKLINNNRKIRSLYNLCKNIKNSAEAYKILKYPEPNKMLFTKEYQNKLKKDLSIRNILSSNFNLLNNLTLVDLKKLLPENYLMVDDKINMHFSIESRVPFLDNRIVSISEEIPSKYKSNNFKGKLIIRKIMNGLLPERNIKRKKYGFTAPATLWFNENYNMIKSNLLKGKTLYKYISKEEVIKMLERKNTDDINKIWTLLFLNLWIRQYIENEKINSL